MQTQNQVRKPVFMVALTILILLGVSFIPGGKKIADVKIKKVDILSDLKNQDEKKQEEMNKYYEYFENDDDVWGDETEEAETDSDDTSMNNLISEREVYSASVLGALLNILNPAAEADRTYINGRPIMKKEPIRGNMKQMEYFFEDLKAAKRKIVRVAHFGDSIIGGDLITMELRKHLQQEFGGNAVGFVSITSNDIKFRMTTKQTFNEDSWNTVEYSRNPKKLPIGINGQVSTPKNLGAWVQYETTPFFKDLNNYGTVKLYYSDALESSVNVSFNGGAARPFDLKAGKDLQELVIKAPRNTTNVKFEFPIKEQANFYGVSLEDQNGLYIDNYSFQGQTGEKLDRISGDMLKQFNKFMDYRLVVFQFGLNVIDKILKDPQGYEKNMIAVINHFKKAMPQTSFLLVGVNDKGFKKGTEITTDPAVKLLVGVQKSIAKETDIAFWNLFEAMGGEKSMDNWVKNNPPLASSDYTHFNDQGAALVSELLAEAIIDAYKKHGK